MSKSSLNDIQKALYQQMTNDPDLTALISGVFDYVPDNQAFPYIVLSGFIETPWNTFSRNGKNVLATIHIYSEQKGNKEAYTILNRMNQVLDGATLPLDNHSLVSIQFEDSQNWSNELELKEVREVAVRYRLLAQEN
jgi:hypothetical protein